MWIWILVFAAIALVWWLFFTKAKPAYFHDQRLEDLPQFLHSLRGAVRPGGLLFCKHNESERFLQFRKDLTPDGKRRIHVGFPNATWSRSYYPVVRELFAVAGVAFTEKSTGEEGTSAFLLVDGMTQVEAFRVAELACRGMGLGPEARFDIHLDAAPSYTEWRDFIASGRSENF
jgi:hypothetical protein